MVAWDVLVNNAGVPTHVPIEDITLKYWQEVLDVNLTAAFLCSREAIKIMKSQTPQGGRIINIGSVSAKTPRPDSLPYTATKFALQGMTHQLTMDGRKYGVEPEKPSSHEQSLPTFANSAPALAISR
jgi:NAD(P)-dependent dehydrogenase (short-subunit alcohol dehydrogenase family)